MVHFPQCIASNGTFCTGDNVGDSDDTCACLNARLGWVLLIYACFITIASAWPPVQYKISH